MNQASMALHHGRKPAFRLSPPHGGRADADTKKRRFLSEAAFSYS
jgi:hypothetical protein